MDAGNAKLEPVGGGATVGGRAVAVAPVGAVPLPQPSWKSARRMSAGNRAALPEGGLAIHLGGGRYHYYYY